jgi:hypothetical protein
MATDARAREAAAASWLRRLAAALLGLNILLALYVAWRSAVLTPYYDEIDWLERWRRFQQGGHWIGYLFEPVNLHRAPMLFGLVALDAEVFGASNWTLIASGAAALALMAWLLAREAARAAPPPLGLPAAALAVTLALMGSNVLDAATPICVNYVHGAALAVGAIILAEGGASRGLSWRRLAALLVAALAGLGDGAALALWPVLALGALRRGDRAWLAAVLVAAAAFIAAYGWDQGAAAQVSTSGALRNPLGALRLSLNFLPLPWTRASVELAWVAGAAIAAAGLAAVAMRGGPHASRSERVAAGFILFSLGVAAMAGLGRTGGDPLNVPLRYGVLLAPLHAGFLILALPYAGVLWRANRKASVGFFAALLVLAGAQNLLMADAAIRTSDKVRRIVADFRAGVRTPDMPIFIHPNLAKAERAYAEMAREGRYQHELHLKPRPPPR